MYAPLYKTVALPAGRQVCH